MSLKGSDDDPSIKRFKIETEINNLVPTNNSILFQLLESEITNQDYFKEYCIDIWNYLIKQENEIQWPEENYMEKQKDLNNEMRSILIDWIGEIVDECQMNPDCLFLSVYYIDIFLSNVSVTRNKLQLVGTAAIMIAAKLEEINVFNTKQWAYLTDKTYTSQQITLMEKNILKILNFKLQPPTTFKFVRLICEEHKFNTKIMYLAMFLCELMLLEGNEYFNYRSSMLGAASIVLARYTLSAEEVWPKSLENYTGYSLKQLSVLVFKLQLTFTNLDNKTALKNKYQKQKYEQVSVIKPKFLGLQDYLDK